MTSLRIVVEQGRTHSACNPAVHESLANGAAVGSGQPVDLELACGSDCVLRVRPDPAVAPGCIALSDVQAYNLHVVAGDTHSFRLFTPPAGPWDLVDADIECRMLHAPDSQQLVCCDSRAAAAALKAQACNGVIAVNQSFILALGGVKLALRVTCTNTLSEEERAAVIGHHCFRGRLTEATVLYMHTLQRNSSGCSSASGAGSTSTGAGPTGRQGEGEGTGAPAAPSRGGVQLVLEHRTQRPAPLDRRDTVHVLTRDLEGGEVFDVKKVVLRPCINLTRAVRADTGAPIQVDVDTLVFDRVLLFLEALACGTEPPEFSLLHVDDLDAAAEVLGLRQLHEYCQARLGKLSGLRLWRYPEISEANASGHVLLILDGMCLDATAWLPQHPGGTKIIPAQALNMDCSRFFEIYHATRESFLFLRDLYVGELHPDDRPSVPMGRGGEHPSRDFLQQLTQYTSWRLPVACGGGDHLHLGRSAR